MKKTLRKSQKTIPRRNLPYFVVIDTFNSQNSFVKTVANQHVGKKISQNISLGKNHASTTSIAMKLAVIIVNRNNNIRDDLNNKPF